MTESSQEAINHMRHDHYYRGHDSYLAILLPNPFYLGPWAVPRSWTVPVGTEDCGHTKETCNGQLKLGSKYRFIVTAFTSYSPPETIISFSAFSEPQASVSVGTEDCGHTKETCNGQLKLGSKHRKTHQPIPIHSFRQSYKSKSTHVHQAFFLEFKELKEVGKEQPRLETKHPPNTTKNHHPHVLPYDPSRDRLTQLEGEPHSDYINTNFITVNRSKGATQLGTFLAMEQLLQQAGSECTVDVLRWP
ncbi:hypothetical protein P7K49_035685 [Saguinus oedipus]|uniref:Tyrosine-protein phosphatase domain-containing protein n=1 Tax=Saguinus oedipus TaxID=9490 RepID=A0ABQ9TP02_SAGOE|nr:hypothetical protein P7K49_035685 [Saguinus oedipus]